MKRTLAGVMAALMAVSFAAFIVGCDDDDEEVEEVAALGMSTVQGVVERGGLSARIAAAAVAGVTVTLEDAAGNVVATAVTDANGRFKFENVPPGNYVVRVEYQGKTGAWAVSVFQEEVIEMVISLDDAGFANCCIYRDPEPDKPKEPEEPGECNYGSKDLGCEWDIYMPNVLAKATAGWDWAGELYYRTRKYDSAWWLHIHLPSCCEYFSGTVNISCSGKAIAKMYFDNSSCRSGFDYLELKWSVKNGVGTLEGRQYITDTGPFEFTAPITMSGPYTCTGD